MFFFFLCVKMLVLDICIKCLVVEVQISYVCVLCEYDVNGVRKRKDIVNLFFCHFFLKTICGQMHF